MNRIKTNPFLLALFFAAALTEHTQNYAHAQYISTAGSASMGRTGRASMDPAEAIFLNPAAIALIPSFEADLYYRDGRYEKNSHETFWGVTIMDNSFDVVVPGALTYLQGRRHYPGLGYADEQFWQVAFGKFYSKGLAFGISINHLKQQTDFHETYSQWDGGFGFTLHATKEFSAAITYSQFVGPGSEIPDPMRLQPLLGMGVRYNYDEIIEVRADTSKQELGPGRQRWSPAAGFRTFLGQFLNVSLGGRRDGPEKREVWSAGVEFNGPKMKISYAYEKKSDESRGAMHSVDLRMPF